MQAKWFFQQLIVGLGDFLPYNMSSQTSRFCMGVARRIDWLILAVITFARRWVCSGHELCRLPRICTVSIYVRTIVLNPLQTNKKGRGSLTLCYWLADYIHRMGIANRDIKLENTLIEREDPRRKHILKITDFGYCKSDQDSIAKSKVGTPGYTGESWYRPPSRFSVWASPNFLIKVEKKVFCCLYQQSDTEIMSHFLKVIQQP